MNRKISKLIGLAVVLLGASAIAGATYAQEFMVKQAEKGVYLDAAGKVVDTTTAVAAMKALPAKASPAKACLQLHLGAAVFNFNLDINADVYPYPVTGGTLTGTICGGAWHVTGGTLGSTLSLKGAINNPVPNCAKTIAVVGNANVPSGYAGTYGFNGSSTMFNHHTLFLGFQKATCP
jgi:hypothetical protein